METKKSNTKLAVILAIVVVAIIAIFLLVNNIIMPKPEEGNKTVTVEVIHKDGTSKTFEYKTDEDYLGALLAGEGLVDGYDGGYGLFITTCDDYEANEDEQEWWCITADGETVMSNVDETPLADGSKFELTLTIGYEF